MEKEKGHLFGFSHEETEETLEKPLKTRRVEPDDVGGYNDSQGKAEDIYDGVWVAIGGIEVPGKEA